MYDVPTLNQETHPDRLLKEALQANRDLKVSSKEELMLLTQTLKERNAELIRVSQEKQTLLAQVHSQQTEFERFRAALRDLKKYAKEGALTYDVLHGPELMSFSKQIERLKHLNAESVEMVQKLEQRCQAMSNQIIDKQKKINRLEALVLRSEEKRLFLEDLVRGQIKPVKSNVQVQTKTLEKRWSDVVAFIQRLPERIPNWIKT